MRFLSVVFGLLTSSFVLAAPWQPYPDDLPVFRYPAGQLQQHWPQLTLGTAQPWPDQTAVHTLLTDYPQLQAAMLEQASQEQAHPALQALLQQQVQPLADALQQVWRLHYEGHFQQAYELGMQLGPLGAVPALYARLMHTALIVTDPDEKLALFRDTAAVSEQLLPLAPGYAFAEFGLLYARARILELLDTSGATASGFLGSTQDALQALAERYPQQGLYPASLGGMQAGIVERVGSFVGRLTYGATESRALAAFEKALSLQSGLPVMYFEYSVALGRLDADKYHQRRLELLQQCLALPVFSAEEALNQSFCARHYQQLTAATHD